MTISPLLLSHILRYISYCCRRSWTHERSRAGLLIHLWGCTLIFADYIPRTLRNRRAGARRRHRLSSAKISTVTVTVA